MSKIISGSQTGSDSRMQVISRADFQLGLRVLPFVVRINTLLPKKRNSRTRKALMRGPAVHGPIQAAARSASLHRVGGTVFHRPLAKGVEAMFIFVAFRRFPQFSDNQRREQPTPATRRPAATIMTKVKHDLRRYQSLADFFRTNTRFRAFQSGEFSREMPAQTNAREPVKSFHRVCPALFLSAQSVIFLDTFVRSRTPDRSPVGINR